MNKFRAEIPLPTFLRYNPRSNGNMTNDGINTLVYDAENHVTSATSGSASGTYTYDGNGQRVEKSSGGTTIVTIFAGAQVLAEYYNGALPSSPTNDYIYAGSLRVASIQSGATNFWHNDHLSPRVRTDSSGNVSDQRGTFPFGETWYSPGASPYMFTTYYRDSESANDYAQARSYVGGLGRFSSPDPIAGSTSDPQSLNRYSYVRNMPIQLTDPFGTCPPVAQNHDSTDSQDTKSGGPSATDSGDPAEADPQGVAGGGSCQSAPWYYTLGGGGGDGALGGGFGGGGVSIDGGETFYPGDGAGGLTGIGTDPFSILDAAFTPTSYQTVENPDCPNGDCAPGTPETISVPVYGNLGLLGLLGGLQGSSSGGGNNISQLRLVTKMDCLDLNGRWINYSLVSITTGNAPSGQGYSVTENISDSHVETSATLNQFNDWQGPPLPGQIFSTRQSFTITGPGATNALVPVREAHGQDYGTLGIWRKGNRPFTNATILINGQPAPDQMSLGKYCPNDRIRP